jgi:uncharacterized protein (DUF169 family)
MDLTELGKQAAAITKHLALKQGPVAIGFRDSPSTGVPHVGKQVPAGCSFWKMASDGHVFHTRPADHFNCAIGAHTHAIKLPEARRDELGGLVQTMVGLSYLREDEVPKIPVLKRSYAYILYAPLDKTPFEPDVVLLRANARQLMVASEAAIAAGLSPGAPLRERPTCAIIPEVMDTLGARASFACVGNRTYTGLSDDEVYFAVPGSFVAPFAQKLSEIDRANVHLADFHRKQLARYTDAATM